MREIRAVEANGTVIAVGMSAEYNGKKIERIEEFGGNINDPRNRFPRLGFTGYDNKGEVIFEMQTTNATVYY